MKDEDFNVLALDTSNYTTSVAIVSKTEKIILERRTFLRVKQGERGLRQSDALFQHNQNLPAIIEDCFVNVSPSSIRGIAVSDKPRPISGSYMPVFRAGLSVGKILASALEVPLFRFSHQEGHVAAALFGSCINSDEPFLAFHLSGGTTELLYVSEKTIVKIGGTKDISFGQVIDRIGVKMGLEFPAGKQMDIYALKGKTGSYQNKTKLRPVHLQGLDINLSGLESEAMRWIENENPDFETLSSELLTTIGESLMRWMEAAVKKSGCTKILFTGGVASSETLRKILSGEPKNVGDVHFGKPALSTDNAVGIGILGVKELWP
ncbi:MAG TPA: hypothetical protein VFC96_00490 [Anaerovoracaceae bacterium]|nr:hypothetical protein [Anaerovoracaceae bacterium]